MPRRIFQHTDIKQLFRIQMRHLVVVLVTVTAMFAAALHTANAQGGMRIAAVVNDEAISFLDLESRIVLAIGSSRLQDGPQTRRRMAPEILRTLIEERIMHQEAQNLELKVTSEEVAEQISTLETQNGMAPGGMRDFLRQINIPFSTITTKMEAELAWSKVIRQILLPKVKIGDEEIDEVIKQIESNEGKPQYHLAELFLPVIQASDTNQVQQAAIALVEQIQNGAPFSRMARNFSRAPSAATSGDMGWLQAHQIDPEILRVVLAMKPGQVSLPIHTLGGYYIILLRNMRVSSGIGKGDATLKLSQFHFALGKDATNVQADQKRAQLEDLTNGISTCDQLDTISKRFGSPLSGSIGTVKLSVLPDNMRAVLNNLPAGIASPPVVTGGGLAVIMICEREDQKLEMETVRNKIHTRLLNQRIDVAARSYLRDLMRSAFVDVRL